MSQNFSQIMSSLRKGRGISQRKAAGDLSISQALLSHYENGMREPGLSFVCRACDYYGVTADYLLGREEEGSRDAKKEAVIAGFIAELRTIANRAEEALENTLK